MNEVILNTKDIESIWEKDNLCFVKMSSGKIWICDQITKNCKTRDFIVEHVGFVKIPLSKGKCE